MNLFRQNCCLVFGLCLGILLTGSVRAELAVLQFSSAQTETAKEILEKLSQHHYRKLALDDQSSAEIFDNFIDTLDPLKSYYLQSDIDEFARYRDRLDDALLNEDLEPGFALYNRFRQRMHDRLTDNISLLESDHQFNFELEESLVVDKDARTWAKNTQEANDYWRKRVKDALLRLVLSGKEMEASRELLVKRYRTQLKQLSQQDNHDVFELFISALTELYDPHTSYLSPRTLENFNIAMSLSLEGIGAVLQNEYELTNIVRIVAGGPADRETDLRPGDKIIGVAQGENGEMVDIVGWRIDDVVQLIRGKKDTIVRLEIQPAKDENSDNSRIVTIVRDKVKLEEQAAKSEIIELPVNNRKSKIGVITIPAFYMDFDAYRNRDPDFKSTTRDVQKLLDRLEEENVDGIVLDLRNNGGGSLIEATALTDLFIDPGPVVQIRHANERISRNQRSRRTPYYQGPLVVLINRLSASASEIFAGAIQDYGRGLVFGSTSFGKGTVQVMAPLKEGQLKFTESKFYRVSGDSTQHRGVIPDIEFPSYYSDDDIGESSQEHALPWDSIHSVRHSVYQIPNTLLSQLRTRHAQRVALDPDWNYMLDEINILETQRDTTEISLNKAKREALRKSREAQLLEIENKRRTALRLDPYKTYEEFKESRDVEKNEREADGETNESDPLLREASQLLVDYIDLYSDAANAPRIVQKIATGDYF